VVAEGVETAEQARGLKALGCQIVQGFYFSKPLPADEFDRLVSERARIQVSPPSVFTKAGIGAGTAGPFKNVSDAVLYSLEALYVVDTETGGYTEFSPQTDPCAARPVMGDDFFSGLEAGLLKNVLPQDWDKAAACRKDALLAQVRREGSFTTTLRLYDGREVRHYRLHAAPAKEAADRRVIVCLEDADFHARREAAFDQAQAESLTYTMIAQALAKDYFSIYLVDLQTEDFVEYSVHPDRQELHMEQRGRGFFEAYRQRLLREAYEPDLEKALTIWDRDRMVPLLREGKTLSAVYRMLISGAPAYIRCKIHRMTDGTDDQHIVVGVSNVDAQMKRQQELESAREISNRDALTGVKSRHAFIEAEQHWNAMLSRGERNPFAVVVCDVNSLKAVNDTQGHRAGDKYIREASALICGIFKHSPVYRVGGDEFAVILSGRDYETRRALFSQMDFVNLARGKAGNLTIACGMAALDRTKDESFEAVFERADAEMYKNKRDMKAGKA
jgi:diguanylate cyclase (GGDEF)-like protein